MPLSMREKMAAQKRRLAFRAAAAAGMAAPAPAIAVPVAPAAPRPVAPFRAADRAYAWSDATLLARADFEDASHRPSGKVPARPRWSNDALQPLDLLV